MSMRFEVEIHCDYCGDSPRGGDKAGDTWVDQIKYPPIAWTLDELPAVIEKGVAEAKSIGWKIKDGQHFCPDHNTPKKRREAP